MSAKRIPVHSSAGTYAVVCASGLLASASGEISRLSKSLKRFSGVYLLTSPRVARHWQKKLEAGLRRSGWRATIVFDDREAAKNLATVERISRKLVRAGADRGALLVAVGGGVVGDVCGFVAASFLRGVALIHIPTTLVAQVDSAIGGKTGVNLPEGKNLVGAFYPARLVLADPRALDTLPDREYRSGLYEVVKCGVIGDAKLFAYLEDNIESLRARDAAALGYIIPRCIQAKADVVGRDERESGLREILNYGHTFAHALETATGYKRYLHGEAVGWGMIAAARLAARLKMFSSREADRVEALVRRVGPLPAMPATPPARLVEIMRADKKTRAGKLRFVLARRIGKVETISGVPRSAVLSILAALRDESA